MRGFRLWWQQPDHYDWLSAYLAARGLTALTRYLLAAILAMLGVATILMMFSGSGPRTVTERVVSIVVTASLFVVAAGYARRWPRRAESQLFSVAGSVCIATACLVDSDPRAGMLGCAAFIGLAGYIAFFHSARYLAFTLVISLTTAAVCAVRVAMAGDPFLAVSKLLVMGGGIIAVPLCGQLLVNWLSVDALKSSTDALTGLRNRRGFRRAALEMMKGVAGTPDRWFTVVMIDLDAFKKANDTYGHAVGDMILVAVADSLRKAADVESVVGRIGGEEFVVAVPTGPGEADAVAEDLRAAVAATSWNVSASVGVASIDLCQADGDFRDLIDDLIAAADTAMYEAKRAGGNQIRRFEVPLNWRA